ncbi:MAG: hypothetical protein GXO99_02285, partial [Nitrospirae bacterium]|nr:hypothetical protein [Nitrospirota bacterium]
FAYSDGKGLWIVDQHAAHERIRYEKLRRPSNQSLSTFLFPKQIRLSPAAFNTLKENMSWLKKFIDIDVFGENTFVVRALPDFLNQVDLQGLLYDLAKTIQDGTGKTPIEELKDDVLKTMACHSSIRGNRRLSREELLGLLMELKEMEDPDHCPHGRPTRIKLDLKELRRLFKRQ